MQAGSHVTSCGQQVKRDKYILGAFSAFIAKVSVLTLDLHYSIILDRHIYSFAAGSAYISVSLFTLSKSILYCR